MKSPVNNIRSGVNFKIFLVNLLRKRSDILSLRCKSLNWTIFKLFKEDGNLGKDRFKQVVEIRFGSIKRGQIPMKERIHQRSHADSNTREVKRFVLIIFFVFCKN